MRWCSKWMDALEQEHDKMPAVDWLERHRWAERSSGVRGQGQGSKRTSLEHPGVVRFVPPLSLTCLPPPRTVRWQQGGVTKYIVSTPAALLCRAVLPFGPFLLPKVTSNDFGTLSQLTRAASGTS